MQTSGARLGVPTTGNLNLVSLPPPQHKVVAAVYKFRDQTGQYKPSVTGANWSTAVTQGATTILIKSLEDSGWFTPIERENLGNLLNERKIIRSTRAEAEANTGQKEPPLPPLLFAGVVLEGGIISYDANVVTGGAGLRYFGAGGSGQYREDKITVYLRAISTSTGEILKTVYTSKTIPSQSVDFGVFRYVKFKRLLEAETGFTYNEPSEIAVKEAIDKAVQSLIIEGIFAGYWALRDKQDIQSPIVREYMQEREDIKRTDIYGRLLANRRGVIGISLAAGGLRYNGDLARQQVKPMAEAGLRISGRGSFAFDTRLGAGELGTARNFERKVIFGELNLNYSLFPRTRYTPYLQGGGGVLSVEDSFSGSIALKRLFPYVKGGMGIEYLATDRLGIEASVSSNYLFDDNLDDIDGGRFNDYYWVGKIGVTYYFGLFK
ncbi:CsgG/HfaB family protein [Pontibacter russatus]|uniref:CsgG/HfaB family protein n=1 Tax=Pontibacter russatus TaxID=2694929 RepID=UPI001F478EC3|nr:CsgG/HfaB family protein [Pontibacter russatus]